MIQHAVGRIEQIPRGEGRVFAVAGRRIAVYRTDDGGVFASQADCPHKGGPLADGLLGHNTIVCPLHDRTFDLRTGDSTDATCRITVHPATIAPDGTILLRIADPVAA